MRITLKTATIAYIGEKSHMQLTSMLAQYLLNGESEIYIHIHTYVYVCICEKKSKTYEAAGQALLGGGNVLKSSDALPR